MAGFTEITKTTDPVEILRILQEEAYKAELPKSEQQGLLTKPTISKDDESYGIVKFIADWWTDSEEKVKEARKEVLEGLVNMPMPTLPQPPVPDELMDVPTVDSEPIIEGAPEQPEMLMPEPYKLDADTRGNELGLRGLMSPELKESIDETVSDVVTESDADGVQPTDGKDPTQDLLDRIAIGEGAKPELLKAQEKHGIGTTQYDMVYGFGDYAVPSKPVSEMTMKELYDYQTALINATKGKVPGTDKGTSASGKYQVTRKSLFGSGTAEKPMKNSWADKLNLKADTVYTPELQEKIAMLALKEAGYNAFIRGNKTEKAFHDRIADIWASVAKASGQDKYDQGTHTVKADLEPMYKLLRPVKTENTNRLTSPRPMLRPDEEEE